MQRRIQDFLEGGRQPIFQPKFPENFMKMKKFEPGTWRGAEAGVQNLAV